MQNDKTSWRERRKSIIKMFRYDWSHAEYFERHDGKLNKTVVHIPARSSSTRLPGKNIALVGGHPLISFSIRQALAMENVDRVIVNTDSEKYAEIAREYGAETPFIRPKEYAHSRSGLDEAQLYLQCHLLNENYPLCRIITLLPTSPLRNIHKLNLMNKELDHAYCVSFVMPTISHKSSLLERDKIGRYISRSNTLKYDGLSLKTLGYFSGINNVKSLKEPRQYLYYLIDHFMETMDIDTARDFEALRYIVDNNLYNFGCSLWN